MNFVRPILYSTYKMTKIYSGRKIRRFWYWLDVWCCVQDIYIFNNCTVWKQDILTWNGDFLVSFVGNQYLIESQSECFTINVLLEMFGTVVTRCQTTHFFMLSLAKLIEPNIKTLLIFWVAISTELRGSLQTEVYYILSTIWNVECIM